MNVADERRAHRRTTTRAAWHRNGIHKPTPCPRIRSTSVCYAEPRTASAIKKGDGRELSHAAKRSITRFARAIDVCLRKRAFFCGNQAWPPEKTPQQEKTPKHSVSASD